MHVLAWMTIVATALVVVALCCSVVLNTPSLAECWWWWERKGSDLAARAILIGVCVVALLGFFTAWAVV